MALPRVIQEALHRLADTYAVDGHEDKGANGWLFFAVNRVTAIKVAIKFYWWGDQPELHVEPRLLAQFSSPHIVPVMAAELIGDGWACFIMPRFASDLEAMIARGLPSLHRALSMTMDVLSGLSALHGASIVHRDLKPANLLISEAGVAAIGDFGSVASLDDDTQDAPASKHSVLYRPPESILTLRYGRQGDIYQVGVVLYELLGGSLPKDGVDWLTARQLAAYRGLADYVEQSIFINQALESKIRAGRVIDMDSLPFCIPNAVKRVVRSQTNVDPDRRAQLCAEFSNDLLALRRQAIDWSWMGDHALGRYQGGVVKVVEADELRVEVNRGNGWRRDRSLEAASASESCALVNGRFA